jgi:two-component system, sensor histidine kinase PdtaS
MTADQGGPARNYSVFQRLGVRLAVLMAAALLPLGILAYLQTSNLSIEAQARSEEALMGETLRAASGEIGAIRTAQGLVAGLAPVMPELIQNTPDCIAKLRIAAATAPAVRLLSFVPVDGKMVCASTGTSYDYAAIPLFQQVIKNHEPAFVVNRAGPVTGQSVLGILHPVFDASGAYLGYVGAWLPHDELVVLKDDVPRHKDVDPTFWTFDSEGEILTSSIGLDEVRKRIPAHITLKSLIGTEGGSFDSFSSDGQARTYALLPIVKDQLYLMSSFATADSSLFASLGVRPIWFPLLLWIAGLGMSVLAAELLVVRHIRVLNQSMSAFAMGQRSRPQVALSTAPMELNEMADAYSQMTDSIMRDEAKLEDVIHQKEVLLREVHHRVKNNLQLIASIMSMQIRQARAPESKMLLKGLQDRVMSLATIHHGLYQTSGLSDIRADELLAEIVQRIVSIASGPGNQHSVVTDFDDIHLTPDQAVPLSLLLTEAMTNAMKYAGRAGGGPAQLRITFKRIGDGQVQLVVLNSIDPGEQAEETTANSTGLGAQLLAAFAMQIGGQLEKGRISDQYRLSVIFTKSALSEAESRRQPDAG